MGYYRNNLKVERDNVTGGGGLLWQTTSTGVRAFPFYDGNGNICGYTNASGAVQARYLYDGFLNATQTGSGSYRYQASTKSWNPALGLLEYQFRAYSPELGRWIQEDPIGEAGGKNLYGFVRNNSIIFIDSLGYEYRLGNEPDPNIGWDNGFAYDSSVAATWKDSFDLKEWQALLWGAESLGHLPDGCRA